MNRRHRSLGPDVVSELIVDTDPWLSCDDCFRLVDGYVEGLLADPSSTLPAMRVHLRGCPACAEEAETLLTLAAQDAGVDPVPAFAWIAGTDAGR
jgi:hypothetical protein